jgi:hypothetical protein
MGSETIKCMHRRRENLARDGGLQPGISSVRPVNMNTSRESTPTTTSRGARPPKSSYSPPGRIMMHQPRWISLIWLVAQDILDLRNCPGRFQHLGPSREDGDTLLRRIEHRLHGWQDASNIRCDERIIRVQHCGSTL